MNQRQCSAGRTRTFIFASSQTLRTTSSPSLRPYRRRYQPISLLLKPHTADQISTARPSPFTLHFPYHVKDIRLYLHHLDQGRVQKCVVWSARSGAQRNAMDEPIPAGQCQDSTSACPSCVDNHSVTETKTPSIGSCVLTHTFDRSGVMAISKKPESTKLFRAL